MTGEIWLLLAAACLAPPMVRGLRRLAANAMRGRTRQWRVRIDGRCRLRARGLTLRLHGVAVPADPAPAMQALAALVGRQSVRLRVLGVDADGTLAVLMRRDGRNVAVALVAGGLLAVRGTGARRYRQAQAAAQIGGRGLWHNGDAPPLSDGWPNPPPVPFPFPWWQG